MHDEHPAAALNQVLDCARLVRPWTLADSVRELKQYAGGEIAMSGSSTLVRSILDLRLLDELNLLVYPVIVGRGKRLAEVDGDPLPCELIESTAFDNGAIHQLYRPAS